MTQLEARGHTAAAPKREINLTIRMPAVAMRDLEMAAAERRLRRSDLIRGLLLDWLEARAS